MAYIPPHKRNTKDTDKADPLPALHAPQKRRNLSVGSPKSSSDKSGGRQHFKPPGVNFIYANTAVSRWFVVGSGNDDVLPPSVSLTPAPLGFVKYGEKPLALLNTEVENTTEVGGSLKCPWMDIAENVVLDLLSSFQVVRNEIESEEAVALKPSLVARFGKILFHRGRSLNTETMENDVLSQSTLRSFRKTFNTNLPSSYLDNITSGVVRKIGLDAEKPKEIYHVKLLDKEKPDATIICKCKVTADGKRLELHKIELNQVRHAVMDFSCLFKKLDLRLMLYTKKMIAKFSDDDMHSIQDLINSAVLDSNVKGGLRWPFGKDCYTECRYSVVGVSHTKSESFRNLNLRLRVRSANRFDFKTSTGEFSREVVLKLTGIISKLKEPNVNASSLLEVLSDSLNVMWNHFLHCDNFLDLASTSSS